MYSFVSYLFHYFFTCFSGVDWILKLIPSTKLLSTISTLPKYSASAYLFQAGYVGCDVSSGFAGVICLTLLEFSVTAYNFLNYLAY